MTDRADIAIIGAGMAGASLAAEVAGHASVLLVEAESQAGYHATGRSAAFWAESYGGPLVQPLTTASGPLLREGGFMTPRGAIHLADSQGAAALARMEAQLSGSSVKMEPLERRQLEARIAHLRPGWDRGLLEPSCANLDVAALHAACLGAARRNGARLVLDARVERLERSAGGWAIQTRAGQLEAGVLVNAAGAWADQLAQLAGIGPLGIQPYRRTIVQLKVDPEPPPDLPLVIDVLGRFYFKPEAGGRLWLSPHDETACPACDCAPEEVDVAVAIDRLQQVVDWRVVRVEHSWAGLRSFAPDRAPVYGFADERRDFFWCAGQGGFGIQTAPAAAKLATALLLGRPPDTSVADIDPSAYLPARLAS